MMEMCKMKLVGKMYEWVGFEKVGQSGPALTITVRTNVYGV